MEQQVINRQKRSVLFMRYGTCLSLLPGLPAVGGFNHTPNMLKRINLLVFLLQQLYALLKLCTDLLWLIRASLPEQTDELHGTWFKQVLLEVKQLNQLLRETTRPAALAAGNAGIEPAIPPEHVTTDWIIDYLGIHRNTFYNQVYGQLLLPEFYVGKRPYYLKEDVTNMARGHEKGAHTYRPGRPK